MARDSSSLMVRMDAQGKSILKRAAELRRMSVSDYVRSVMLAQAEREVSAARENTLALTPAEQLAFWTALAAPPRLTVAKKRLGAMMRGQE